MKRQRFLFLLVIVALLAGCAVTPPVKPDTKPTALERAKLQSLLMMERYTAQLKDAESLEALVISKQASVQQVRIYKIKRQMLIEVRPLIDTFDKLIADGGIPPAGQEQQIFDLLNRLAAAAG